MVARDVSVFAEEAEVEEGAATGARGDLIAGLVVALDPVLVECEVGGDGAGDEVGESDLGEGRFGTAAPSSSAAAATSSASSSASLLISTTASASAATAATSSSLLVSTAALAS